ncbi:MAG: VTC domain-containing protein [Chloroflexi bacterium]|nr:VTC domain-containing protein [Chloroflexota bacterium]
MYSEPDAMPTTPALRYEVKMTCNEVYLPDVHAWLRLHREGFSEAYPSRRINNLYLDTLDYDCLYDNLNGAAERAKLRLRWYGEALERAEGVLELKGKVAQQGWKRSSARVALDLRTGSWADLLAALRSQTEGLFDVWLGALAQPVLINHYRRAYYESADHALRATIDWEQVAYEQVTWPRPNLDAPAFDNHQIVVEIKADGAAHRRISDLLTSFPLRTGRNSKYVSSVLSALP